jgi:hypothetical protein
MHRFIPLTMGSPSVERMRTDFTNLHSKHIHASWLIKEDLGREVEIDDQRYIIYGLWDMIGVRYLILLNPIGGGPFLVTDSRRVANALGYSRMRNLVTGEEHTWTFKGKKSLIEIEKTEPPRVSDNDESGEADETPWSKDKEEGEFVDPLIQALLDDITDDGDTSAM